MTSKTLQTDLGAHWHSQLSVMEGKKSQDLYTKGLVEIPAQSSLEFDCTNIG